MPQSASTLHVVCIELAMAKSAYSCFDSERTIIKLAKAVSAWTPSWVAPNSPITRG